MNGFMIFSFILDIVFIFALIILTRASLSLKDKCDKNKEFIEYLIVKYGELKTHCDRLERRVKCHRLELDRLEREKGSDDETAF